ncbi:hypothetical protein [Streptomyces beihaiensis]|uniref:Uncharacterized protein n=1 Tax=Streptomyces beihaiensis TaxID=2984495 RepID=A0ABT3U073_9ACTN|nr:hypothetical protein [Streptomyces beihaiensis]MCX3061618.1 hypothetical protein [Streptomyces beihaiensis]
MAENTPSHPMVPWTEFRPDRRRLAAGAALIGVGTLVCAAGIGVLVYELTRAGRTWTGSWQVPPGELAHRTLHQAQTAAQSAAHAGRDAWQNYQEQAL